MIYDVRPDGRRILFQGGATTTNGLYEIAVGGDHHIRRLTDPPAQVLDEHANVGKRSAGHRVFLKGKES